MSNPPAMEPHVNAGELLKQARLKQRLSITECARRTHVAQHYLEALEDNRWNDLPSESHRKGFLNLYARFLGLVTDELMALYKQDHLPPVIPAAETAEPVEVKVTPKKKTTALSFSSNHILIFLVVLLMATWGAYHWLKNSAVESQSMGWAHSRPRMVEPRLHVSHPVIRQQKIRIHADSSVWLRVGTDQKLLFEGILPAQAEKIWTGVTPFQIKIADVQALHIYWNDQPVDVTYGAKNNINTLQLPPK